MLTTEAASLASTVAPANVAYHRRLVRRQRITFLLLVAPALLWFMTFMLWPLVNMFYISTTHWDGLPLPQTFVFLDNYARLVQGPQYRRRSAQHRHPPGRRGGGVVPFAFMLGFFSACASPVTASSAPSSFRRP